jgi:hypothetical protein
MNALVIEWQRLLDEQKGTCPRCGLTEQEVEKAAQELTQLLAPSDIAVNVVKKAIDLETFKKDVSGWEQSRARANAVKRAAMRIAGP